MLQHQPWRPSYVLALAQVWRLSFFLGLVPVAGMLCWRLFKLEESAMWRDKQKRLQQEVLLGQNGAPHTVLAL